MKPYTYTDTWGDQLKVEDGAITALATGDNTEVYLRLPEVADDAIELAQKILEASGIDARIVTE